MSGLGAVSDVAPTSASRRAANSFSSSIPRLIRASSTASSRYDAGADEVMSYGGVTEDAVRDLVHGAIFTRGPKDLHNTAIFIGGTDMAPASGCWRPCSKAFFGPMRVSVMLDSNGSNTTAVAAVVKLQQAAGDVRGTRVVVTAGTGPVGMRAAGLLREGRRRGRHHLAARGRRRAVSARIQERFGGTVARGRRWPSVAGGRRARRCGAAAQCRSGRRVPRSARRLGGARRTSRRRRPQRRAAARHRRHRGDRRRRANATASRCSARSASAT